MPSTRDRAACSAERVGTDAIKRYPNRNTFFEILGSGQEDSALLAMRGRRRRGALG